jgi:hypothetical protein
MLRYKSLDSFIAMAGSDTTDVTLQIARQLCNDGGRRCEGCCVADRPRALQQWCAKEFFFLIFLT